MLNEEIKERLNLLFINYENIIMIEYKINIKYWSYMFDICEVYVEKNYI